MSAVRSESPVVETRRVDGVSWLTYVRRDGGVDTGCVGPPTNEELATVESGSFWVVTVWEAQHVDTGETVSQSHAMVVRGDEARSMRGMVTPATWVLIGANGLPVKRNE